MVGIKLRSRDVGMERVEDYGKCAREIRKMNVGSRLGNTNGYLVKEEVQRRKLRKKAGRRADLRRG